MQLDVTLQVIRPAEIAPLTERARELVVRVVYPLVSLQVLGPLETVAAVGEAAEIDGFFADRYVVVVVVGFTVVVVASFLLLLLTGRVCDFALEMVLFVGGGVAAVSSCCAGALDGKEWWWWW